MDKKAGVIQNLIEAHKSAKVLNDKVLIYLIELAILEAVRAANFEFEKKRFDYKQK